MRRQERRRTVPVRSKHYGCESLESRLLFTNVTLLKDINTGTASSLPIELGTVSSTLFFTEETGPYAGELFKTDGTAAGSSVLASATQLIPTYDETGVNFNGKFLYPSYASDGNYISISDGTPGGTTPIAQINTDRPSNGNVYLYFAQNFTVLGNHAFFTAPLSTSGTASVMWVTDGTAAGTINFQQLTGNTSMYFSGALGVLGNKLLFTDESGNLWQSDGTAAGTSIAVTDFYSGVNATAFDGKLFMFGGTSTQSGLFATDGTPAGTQLITASAANFAQPPVIAGAKMYYFGSDPSTTGAYALYVYSSTTHSASEVEGGFSTYSNWPGPFISAGLANGKVLFEATSGSQTGIWASDGTAANTTRISMVMPEANFNLNYRAYKWGVLGNNAYFSGSTDNGFINDLYTTDGSVADTQYLAGQTSFSSLDPQWMTNFQGNLYFTGFDLAHGSELWSTTGSAAGTGIAIDLNTAAADSSPQDFTTDGSKVYFDATDTTSAKQPWVTDGTAAGTHMIAPIDQDGDATTYNYVTVGGETFFSANANGYIGQFYETDGTQNGTAIFSPNGISFSSTSYAVLGNSLIIGGTDSTHGKELYKTDGTAAGTTLVRDINPGTASSTPAGFIPFNGKLVFNALDGTGQRQMYITDGTSDGTIALTSFPAGTSTLGIGAVLNSKLYFIVKVTSGAGIGMQLWQTDGTVSGTSLLKQLNNVTTGAYIVATTTAVYFLTVGSTSTTVWKSDGTAAGTVVVKALTSTNSVGSLLVTNNKVFFEGNYNVGGYSGYQLFTTDGTSAGTTIPGQLDMTSLQSITATNGEVYAVSYGSDGSQLWRSDGTAAGTVMAASLSYNGGAIDGVFALGNTLYLDANDGIHGNELMTINLNDTFNGTSAVDTITLSRDTDNTYIDWSSGSVSGKVLINSPGGLTLNGGGNNDVILLDASHGNPLPNVLHLDGIFTIDGLTGVNPLANTNLEVGTSTVYITYANAASDPLATIRGYLQNGYNTGLWTGTPTSTTGVITSTAAAGSTNKSTAIGYADSADGLVTLPANTIELKYTLYGDTGLTGTVGFTDFMRMTQHYTLNSGATWGEGDFNYDGSINSADFNLLQPNYGQTLPARAAAPTVTPPATSSGSVRTPIVPPPVAPLSGSEEAIAATLTPSATTTTIMTEHKTKAEKTRKTRH